MSQCLKNTVPHQTLSVIFEECIIADDRCRITTNVKKLYHVYGFKLGNQDKGFVPHVACISCTVKLRMWCNKKTQEPFFRCSDGIEQGFPNF